MEVLHITDKKLKLTLSAEEAAKHKLDGKRLEELGDVRALLASLLAGVENVSPFLSGRVLVQAYPMRDGGCELFVTRLPSVRRERQEEKEGTSRKASSNPPPSLWRFSSREDLLAAVAVFPEYKGGSFYRVGEDTFVLVSSGYAEHARFNPLLEFASPLPISALDLLAEHAEGVSLQLLEKDPYGI